VRTRGRGVRGGRDFGAAEAHLQPCPNARKAGEVRAGPGKMRHVGLVAAAITAATALSSKQGRELLESKLQPLFLLQPAQQEVATEEYVVSPRQRRR